MAKLAGKTHKDRVNEFNAHLESLSEHHDIPKVHRTHLIVLHSHNAMLIGRTWMTSLSVSGLHASFLYPKNVLDQHSRISRHPSCSRRNGSWNVWFLYRLLL